MAPYVEPVPTESPADPILAALRSRGAAITRVRYRENRSVLLSVSRDGTTLNGHACFRDAPPRIVDAVVRVVTAPRDTADRRAALRTLREWDGTRRGLARARRATPRRRPAVDGPGTGPLRSLFRRLNRRRFGGRLPAIPLRISRRMTRSLGTIRYGLDGVVEEIAISAALLRPANRAALVDTMLHEMAHAEAWLRHGHRGHGRAWKAIARRVGCRPRAVTDIRVAGPR